MYWFLSEKNSVLYVGKAKNLRHRVQSYAQVDRLPSKIRAMVFKAKKIKFQILRSEFEALCVEAELVRLHQPPNNTLLKDDKSPLYILITAEDFPRVLTIRKQNLVRQYGYGSGKRLKETVFGPFPSGFAVRRVLKLVRGIFPWCNDQRRGKPCLYYHLKLCPGVCAGTISKKNYAENIDCLKMFLHGRTRDVLASLKKDMRESVARKDFEKAAIARDQIQSIEYVTAPEHKLGPMPELPALHTYKSEQGLLELKRLVSQHISLPKEYVFHRIEGYDISNIQGTNPTASMVVFTDGRADKSQYRLFNIYGLKTPNDVAMLKEALMRRQKHDEWGEPSLVLIDGGKGQLRAVMSVWKKTIPVVSIAKKPDRLFVPYVVEKKNTQRAKSRAKLHYAIYDLDDYPYAQQLLQQIRDESHRFAKKQHEKLRTRALFST